MKLFFKHLLRSIKRRPLQPFVIVIALMLSVAVVASAFGIKDALNDEVDLSKNERYGTADLSVTLNSNSKSRFMMADSAEALLGAGSKAVGVLDLAMTFSDGGAVFGAACDFLDVSSVFSFGFTEYSDITERNIKDTAVVSSALAKARGISLGDKITVKVFGVEKSYTVRGVSLYPYISGYDMLVDITTAVDALANNSLIASSLGEDFAPFGTLYIDIADGMNTSEGTQKLLSDPEFADKTVIDVAATVKQSIGGGTLVLVLDFVVLFAAVLSAVTAFCCLYVLTIARNEENSIFSSAGAKPGLLYFMQYLEALFYWLVGTVLGFLISIPIFALLGAFAGFTYARPTLSASVAFKSAVLILVIVLFTVTSLLITKKHRGRKRLTPKIKCVSLSVIISVAVLAYLLCFLLPAKFKLEVGMISFVLISLVLCCVSPFAFKSIAALWVKKGERRNSYPSCVRYALKNIFSVRVLHNTARLLSVMTVIILCVLSVVVSSFGYTKASYGIFRADYAVMNPTERAHAKVEECPSAELVARAYMASALLLDDDGPCVVISVSDGKALSDYYKVEQLPEANEVVVSRALSEMHSLEIGDVCALNIEGRVIEFKVKQISSSGVNAFLINAEYHGLKNNITLVKGIENSKEILLDELSSATAGEMASVIRIEELFDSRMHLIKICYNCGVWLMLLVVIFSLIGILDGLYDSYRARRKEFSLYKLSGMSEKTVRRMKLCEILLTAVFGLVFGLIFYVFSFTVLREALFSEAFNLLENMISAFRQ